MPIREFELPADLPVLGDLIPRCFQYPENEAWSLQPEDAANLADRYRSAQRIWPLVRVLRVVWPPLRDMFRGCVWEEDGQPVGVANLIRMGAADRWIIANVGVLPDYRRRGIARRLVAASMQYAQDRGAQIITLGVIDGNLPAQRLYEKLGFEAYNATAQLVRAPSGERPAQPSFPAGCTLREVGRMAWRARYDLAQRIVPADVRRYEPVSVQTYRLPRVLWLLWPLAPVLRVALGIDRRQVIVCCGDQVVAAAWIMTRLHGSGSHHLGLMLDPAHSELAPALIAHLLHSAEGASPGRKVECAVPRWQPAVLAAAREAGFTHVYDHSWMGYATDRAPSA